MRADELSLQEQLVASTAVANYRQAGAPSNSTPALVSPRHAPQRNAEVAMADGFMPAMSIEAARARWMMMREFISSIMQPDEDFGTIPGAKKASLLKPGAEKLTAFFGLVPTFRITDRIQAWDGEPFFHYEIACTLSRDGVVRGEGLGSCNSHEVKYRYRDEERKCPSCGGAFIIKGRDEYGGGWLCFRKKGGCGAKFPDGDAQIESQRTGRVNNPDVADLANTILKMAKKRAHIDAVLNTTGASQFFTQDREPQIADQPPCEVIDVGSNRTNTKDASAYVAERKISELRSQQKPMEFPPSDQAWKTKGQFREVFAKLRELVGEVEYNRALDEAGVAFASKLEPADARHCYEQLVAIIRRGAENA